MSNAESMIAAVAAGQTIFTKAADIWMIVGPAADITPDQPVQVTTKTGTTKTVWVTTVTQDKEARGVAYRVAKFSNTQIDRETWGRPAAGSYSIPTLGIK